MLTISYSRESTIKTMRTCRICDETLRGRSDQIFCSDQCRSHFHNLRCQEERKCYRKINARLIKNRRILLNCRSNGITRMQLSTLKSIGFAPDFHTQVITTGRKLEFRIYDIGYTITGTEIEITGPESAQK